MGFIRGRLATYGKEVYYKKGLKIYEPKKTGHGNP
ncbi:MAG: hypothetical protein ACJAQT_000690 [Akkermansiaceae bacterium]|jgi:hypothetical protein